MDVSIAYLKNQVLSPPARAFVDTLIGLKSDDLHPMGIGLMMAKMLAQRKEDQRQAGQIGRPKIQRNPKIAKKQDTVKSKLKI